MYSNKKQSTLIT